MKQNTQFNNTVPWSCVICIPYQILILLAWSSERGWDEWGLWDLQGRREILFCSVGWGNLKERDNLEDL